MNDETLRGSAFELAWAVWERRKWLSMVVFGALFSAVVSLVLFLPNIYKSTATVLVERENMPEALLRPGAAGEIETRLRTISERILSRSRLQNLIKLFNLYPEMRKKASPEEVIERLRRDIRLELKGVDKMGVPSATVAFALSYQGRDPQTVALVTNTLASFYIEENWRVRGRQATETAEFFRVQLDEMRKRLDEQEGKVSEFKRRHPGDNPQQAQANLAALERLNMQLRMNMERLTRVMERREILARQLGEALPYGSLGSPGANSERVSKLRQELAELRTRYSDQYPDVIRLRTEIAALERNRGETRNDPSVQRSRQALNEVEAEIQGIREEEGRLQQTIAAYHRRLEGGQVAPEVPELLRDYETTKDLYSSLLKRYADAQHAENWETRQRGEMFRLLDSAVAAHHPSAPNRFRIILMALVLALGAAVFAAVLAEQIDTTFHTVDDLRTFTRVPVLVSIPYIVTEGDAVRKRQLFRLAAAAAVLGLVLIVGVSYYIAHENEGIVRMLSRGQRP